MKTLSTAAQDKIRMYAPHSEGLNSADVEAFTTSAANATREQREQGAAKIERMIEAGHVLNRDGRKVSLETMAAIVEALRA